MKSNLIISHERSGSYLTTEFISCNFRYMGYNQRIDIDGRGVNWADSEKFKAFLFRTEFISQPLVNPFKSHHAYGFYKSFLDDVLENYNVFYVVRNPLDVMVSFWNHLWRVNGSYGQKIYDVNEFVKSKPVGEITRYQTELCQSMIERWVKNVASWYNVDGICILRYEDILSDKVQAIQAISEYIGQSAPENIVMPPLGGVTPWSGKSGKGKELLSQNTCDYICKVASRLMSKLAY